MVESPETSYGRWTPSMHDRIDAACLEFEHAVKAGKVPGIDAYLNRVPDADRAALKRELVAIEDEFQSHRSHSVDVKTFRQNLMHSSLLTRRQIDEFLASLPVERRSADVNDLAKEFVRHGLLSEFQVQAILLGRTRGLIIGNYVLLDRLGKGGMGNVYKARHRRMDRIVALKVLPASAAKSQEAVRRFRREMKVAACLFHPNIVTAYDADEVDGVYFLVMECVDGKDLSALVHERGPLSVSETVHCIVQTAYALEYAHGQGVIHRDIKPSNILVDDSGAAKLLDLGLASLARPDALSSGDLSSELTRTGQILGTADFIAPEQTVDARLSDERSDIYSLGCTLYYLLCGRPMYRGRNLMEIVLAHRDGPIPSLQQESGIDVSDGLDAVFRRMVAKRPEDRHQTMSEVLLALKPWHESGGEVAASAPPASSPGLLDSPHAIAAVHGPQSEIGTLSDRQESKGEPIVESQGGVGDEVSSVSMTQPSDASRQTPSANSIACDGQPTWRHVATLSDAGSTNRRPCVPENDAAQSVVVTACRELLQLLSVAVVAVVIVFVLSLVSALIRSPGEQDSGSLAPQLPASKETVMDGLLVLRLRTDDWQDLQIDIDGHAWDASHATADADRNQRSIPLKAGKHVVVITHHNLERFRQTIEVGPRQTVTLTPNLMSAQ